jgi:hypothetical protein
MTAARFLQRSPFDMPRTARWLLPRVRPVRRPGRCPGLMDCRPFRADTEDNQPADNGSPNGAAIREPGASPRAVSSEPFHLSIVR